MISVIEHLIDNHKHKCPNCNTVWEHDGLVCAGSTKDHTCKCGTEVWLRYHGPEQASLEDGLS